MTMKRMSYSHVYFPTAIIMVGERITGKEMNYIEDVEAIPELEILYCSIDEGYSDNIIKFFYKGKLIAEHYEKCERSVFYKK